MWRSSQQVHEAERLRSELVESVEALDTEQPQLDSAQAEAGDASEALSAALAALEPGATASSKDADLAAGRGALTSLQNAVDATVAARGFESSERDRLVSCLASAEQALGVAETNPSKTSSLYALATESCRDATTGAFSAIRRLMARSRARRWNRHPTATALLAFVLVAGAAVVHVRASHDLASTNTELTDARDERATVADQLASVEAAIDDAARLRDDEQAQADHVIDTVNQLAALADQMDATRQSLAAAHDDVTQIKGDVHVLASCLTTLSTARAQLESS